MCDTQNGRLTLQKLIDEIKEDSDGINTIKIGMIGVLSKIKEETMLEFKMIIEKYTNYDIDECYIDNNIFIRNEKQIRDLIGKNQPLSNIELVCSYKNLSFIMCIALKYDKDNNSIFCIPSSVQSEIISVIQKENKNNIRLFDKEHQCFVTAEKRIIESINKQVSL